MVRIEDIYLILEPIQEHDDAILIGGQALNFWAEYYIAQDPSLDRHTPFYSIDIDFLDGKKTADRIHTTWECDRRRIRDESYSPLDTKLKLTLNDKRYVVIDFLKEMEGVDSRLVREQACTTQTPKSGKSLKVLHPLHCMVSRVSNTYGELDRRSRQYSSREINRTKLSIRILHHYLADQFKSEYEADRISAYELINDIAVVAGQKPSLRAYHMDKVDVLESVPTDPNLGLSDAFLNKTYPAMKSRIENIRGNHAPS